MAAFHEETITEVRHWTDRLFSFRATRDPSFRFENGQFAMIGIRIDGKPLLRAYSMASANHDEGLEFFSIKVENGPLTSRLKDIRPGDTLLVGRKTTGTLVYDNLLPGKRLWLVGTGTGFAPFSGIIQDHGVYDRFEQVIVLHGCREVAELGYSEHIVEMLRNDEHLGDTVRAQLIYYPTVTREPFVNQGRVTDGLADGSIPAALGLPPLNPDEDRVMICGSPQMLADMVRIMDGKGFQEGSSNDPGSYVIEKAFAEK